MMDDATKTRLVARMTAAHERAAALAMELDDGRSVESYSLDALDLVVLGITIKAMVRQLRGLPELVDAVRETLRSDLTGYTERRLRAAMEPFGGAPPEDETVMGKQAQEITELVAAAGQVGMLCTYDPISQSGAALGRLRAALKPFGGQL